MPKTETKNVPINSCWLDLLQEFKTTAREPMINVWARVAATAKEAADRGARITDLPPDRVQSAYIDVPSLNIAFEAAEIALGRPASSMEEALKVALLLAKEDRRNEVE